MVASLDLKPIDDRPVALMGYGRSGAASAAALARAGVPLQVWDDDPARRDVALGAGLAVTDLGQADLERFGYLLLSPGIPAHGPHAHAVPARAAKAGLEIVCDIELLFRARPDAIYVGVTGTNGKSTTTALIGHILAETGRAFAIGGNIGTPALDLPALGSNAVYVLELSSFQLELMPTATFHVAVLLNLSPDHLDHHGDMDAYADAKARIFVGQDAHDTAIVGIDTEGSRAIYCDLARGGRQSVLPISGCGSSQAAGGVYVEDGWLIDARAGLDKRIAELAGLSNLPGPHNGENAAAAYAVATALDLSLERVAECFASFPGLAHRLERVDLIGGVLFVNDSKATNADAALRALACYDDIYWIAGGRAKDGDSGLARLADFGPRIRHAYLIGEARGRLQQSLGAGVPTSMCDSLDEAVTRAASDADGRAGAVVLLSPACASFDQFADFEARGEAFRQAVARLPGAQGATGGRA
ncbi:MAG: UDP-N-acetylmuramoyl-L-alanine--D-glutamate ligase [Alphaproteobacteria bacterium]|nr:UDP-N-acetylmuramoyl-L-alanine--D-glutamate ligase [Alphaproteobacteria bacterium]